MGFTERDGASGFLKEGETSHYQLAPSIVVRRSSTDNTETRDRLRITVDLFERLAHGDIVLTPRWEKGQHRMS